MRRNSIGWIRNSAFMMLMAVPVMHEVRANAAEADEQVQSIESGLDDQVMESKEDAASAAVPPHSDQDMDVGDGVSLRDRQPQDQCRWYDGRPYDCQRFAGCFYDHRWNQCLSRGGGGQPYPPQPYPPQPYFCQQFNYNQFECQRQGCFFDYNSQLCFAQGGGTWPQPPTPPPAPPPAPPPGQRGFVCTAIDVSCEGHYGGYRGFGQTQYAAQQAAMGDCLRWHRQCRVTQCQLH